jgi:prepilin-type N-terminal cleavage/methylation domain-containing protein
VRRGVIKVQRGKRGVTLIELAVVMAIVAVMALFLAPPIGEWLDNYRIRQAARDIVSTLNLAKIRAIAGRLEYRVDFDVANNQYRLWVNDGGWVPDPEGDILRTPRGVEITSAGFSGGVSRAKFNPTGTASNGTVIIVNDQGKQYNVVVYRSGRIRIEECHP